MTGAGKSTFCNMLVGNEVIFDDETGVYIPGQKAEGMHEFIIGHEVIGCTQTPASDKVGETMIVDCPGLCDANANNEFPNRTIIHTLA